MKILNNFDLRNVISNPTRVAAISETRIDLCVFNDVEKLLSQVYYTWEFQTIALSMHVIRSRKRKDCHILKLLKTLKELILRN